MQVSDVDQVSEVDPQHVPVSDVDQDQVLMTADCVLTYMVGLSSRVDIPVDIRYLNLTFK